MVGGQWYNVDATWDGTKESTNTIYSVVSPSWNFWDPNDYASYNYFLKSDAYIENLDNSINKSEHVNYHEKYTNSKIYATSTIYDEYNRAYWIDKPVPDAKYFNHEKTQVTSFALSTSSVSLAVGETTQLAVQSIVPTSVNPLASRWTSSNTDVVYVCADGTIVAVGKFRASSTRRNDLAL